MSQEPTQGRKVTKGLLASETLDSANAFRTASHCLIEAGVIVFIAALISGIAWWPQQLALPCFLGFVAVFMACVGIWLSRHSKRTRHLWDDLTAQ